MRTTTRSRPFRCVRSRTANQWQRRVSVPPPAGAARQVQDPPRCVRAGFEAQEDGHPRPVPGRQEQARSDRTPGLHSRRPAAGLRAKRLALQGRPGANPPAKISATSWPCLTVCTHVRTCRIDARSRERASGRNDARLAKSFRGRVGDSPVGAGIAGWCRGRRPRPFAKRTSRANTAR